MERQVHLPFHLIQATRGSQTDCTAVVNPPYQVFDLYVKVDSANGEGEDRLGVAWNRVDCAVRIGDRRETQLLDEDFGQMVGEQDTIPSGTQRYPVGWKGFVRVHFGGIPYPSEIDQFSIDLEPLERNVRRRSFVRNQVNVGKVTSIEVWIEAAA